MRFLFAKKKTSDDVNDESDPLGVGSFEKDANDWRVGDILLLKKNRERRRRPIAAERIRRVARD